MVSRVPPQITARYSQSDGCAPVGTDVCRAIEPIYQQARHKVLDMALVAGNKRRIPRSHQSQTFHVGWNRPGFRLAAHTSLRE